MLNRIVPENKVLITTAIWLKKERKCEIFFCFPTRSRGLDDKRNANQLTDALTDAGVPARNICIRTEGADIMAKSSAMQEVWQVECIGAGGGSPATQHTHFDRGLESIFSHCDGSITSKGVKINYALALPETTIYIDLLQKRVRKPLREQLNLWVLILTFDPYIKDIQSIPPEEDYPVF